MHSQKAGNQNKAKACSARMGLALRGSPALASTLLPPQHHREHPWPPQAAVQSNRSSNAPSGGRGWDWTRATPPVSSNKSKHHTQCLMGPTDPMATSPQPIAVMLGPTSCSILGNPCTLTTLQNTTTTRPPQSQAVNHFKSLLKIGKCTHKTTSKCQTTMSQLLLVSVQSPEHCPSKRFPSLPPHI